MSVHSRTQGADKLRPFSRYYVHQDLDEGHLITTTIPVADLTDARCLLTEPEDPHLTLHIEWVESHLLATPTYHAHDDIDKLQKQQMRREILALQSENLVLEKQLHSYQQSLAKSMEKDGTLSRPANMPAIRPNITSSQTNMAAINSSVNDSQSHMSAIKTNVTYTHLNISAIKTSLTNKSNMTSINSSVTDIQPNISARKSRLTNSHSNVTNSQFNMSAIRSSVTNNQSNMAEIRFSNNIDQSNMSGKRTNVTNSQSHILDQSTSSERKNRPQERYDKVIINKEQVSSQQVNTNADRINKSVERFVTPATETDPLLMNKYISPIVVNDPQHKYNASSKQFESIQSAGSASSESHMKITPINEYGKLAVDVNKTTYTAMEIYGSPIDRQEMPASKYNIYIPKSPAQSDDRSSSTKNRPNSGTPKYYLDEEKIGANRDRYEKCTKQKCFPEFQNRAVQTR